MINKNILPVDFDANEYIRLHPDVGASGIDPKRHYLEFGRREGRLYKSNQLNGLCGIASELDIKLHCNPETKRSTISSHTKIWEWIRSVGNKKNFRVLEIGSRSVVSDALWRNVIPGCDYTGFDIIDGKNVDVVGDVHRLSDYFEPGSFDLILSFAVLEHLAMPWVAAEEISKVLKIGGYLAIETHFSFSEHELPSHFFQFNSRALEVLFCPELGFEVIDSGLDSPIIGRFSHYSADYLKGKLVSDLYCHSSIIARKSINVDGVFDWRKVMSRMAVDLKYPNRK